MLSREDLKTELTHELLSGAKIVAFFDFDNTITSFDILDNIIERFAVDEAWQELEAAWQAGRIGSKECLKGQLQSVRASQRVLEKYLAGIEVDPSFKKLLGLLRKRGIGSLIVSDSFSFFIKTILKNNGVRSMRIHSNELKFSGDKLAPVFPYENADCPKCAHCKKSHLLKKGGRKIMYVGDGLSDFCPAENAEFVFAKGALWAHLQSVGKPCLEFKDLGDVCAFFEELELPAQKPEKNLVFA